MNASIKRTKKPKITVAEQEYVKTLSPKLRKIHLKLIPLRGKLTKALEM